MVIIDTIKVDARTVNDVKISEDGRVGVISREGPSNRKNGLVILDVSDPFNVLIINEYNDDLTGGVHNVFIYEDNIQTLSTIARDFFKLNKIPISQETINLLIERSRGNRGNLKNELNKIESYTKTHKNINSEEILKLTNLAENYEVSELLDNCLSKNSKKTINILNENNFSIEDCIFIIRSFSIKLKRLNKIHNDYKKNNNLDSIISSYKQPIFWKDKNAIKTQINKSGLINIEDMIFKTNDIELLIKKNSDNAVNILSDFIINTSK